MSNNQAGPSRADIRSASKKSTSRVAKWIKDNVALVDVKQDAIVLLEEILGSVEYAGHFGPTVPALRILCTLISGAPSQNEARSMNKIPLVAAMLEASKSMGDAASSQVSNSSALEGRPSSI